MSNRNKIIAVILIFIGSIILTVILVHKRSNATYLAKLAVKQTQIDNLESSNKELLLGNKVLQDAYDISKIKYDSLTKVLKERHYAKDPNGVNNLPIDSTVSYLSDWLSKTH